MKDFDGIYQKICDEYNSQNGNMKNNSFYSQKYFKVLLIILLFVLAISIYYNFIILLFSYLLITSLVILVLESSKKNARFKDIIITSLVRNYDNNLHFSKAGCISRLEYRAGQFEQHFDRFRSEDSIQGLIDGSIPIRMADVITQDESTDSDGNTTTTTLFSGLFAIIDLPKSTGLSLLVHNDGGMLGKMFKSKNRVDMDSSEFEKIFDVTTSDKIKAMQILTSDVMADLIDFKSKYNKRFELTVIDSKLYLRFHSGNVFERMAFKSELDYNTLKTYFNYLNFSCEVSKKIYNVINETQL